MRNRLLAACVVILWCDLICPSASFLVCVGGVFGPNVFFNYITFCVFVLIRTKSKIIFILFTL